MVKRSADPTSEAIAKKPTLITSAATSVNARAACICFCAIRPAKSSSKNVTDWPSVQRFSRDRTRGVTLGCTTMAFAAADTPKDSGRSTTKNATNPRNCGKICITSNDVSSVRRPAKRIRLKA